MTPEEAIGRPGDVETLMSLAEGGHNATLYAPRRLGKTSLLKQTLLAAQERDMPNVLVDLSDVLHERDVAARLEQAFRSLSGGLRRLVDRELGAIGLTTPVGGFTFGRRQQQPDPLAVIHALLELPAKVAESAGQRALIIFDEFQALIALAGMDGVFRSHIQHHDQVSYVFSGSEPSLLRALFEDRARPLYGQATQVRLERVAFGAAYDFVVARFAETGKDSGEVAPQLVQLSERHPQRLMLLAHHLWEQTASDAPSTTSALRVAHDAALRAVDAELRAMWDATSTNERRVLSALASGLSPYEAQARASTGLASRSSAQRSVDGLIGRGILERDADVNVVVVDPLLDEWVRRRESGRVIVWVLREGDGSYLVVDGPSVAFTRARGLTLEDAQAEADRIAGRGGEVVIVDSGDPNERPDWAV